MAADLSKKPLPGGAFADAVTRILVRYRLVFFVVFLVVLGASAKAALRLDFDPSYRIWFAPTDPAIQAYDGFLDTFGNDDAVTIVFTDDAGVFNDKALGTVRRITEEVKKLPYVQRVESLTTFKSMEGKGGDMVVEKLVPALPMSPEALAHARKVAMEDPRARGLLVSTDGKTTQIIATVDTRVKSTERSFEIRRALEAAIDRVRAEAPYDYHVAGNPILETEFVVAAGRDAMTILPFFAGLVILILAVMYRSVLGVVIPLVVSTTSVVITMGFAAAMGVKLNALTSTVPQIVFAYGLSDGIHTYTAYATARNAGDDKETGVARAVRLTLLPCFLSSFATAVGFLSLMTADIGPMREIGLLCGVGVAVEYLVAFFTFPALTSLARKVPPARALSTDFWHRVGLFSQTRPWTIVAVSLAMVAVGGAAMTKLRVNSDLVAYFKDKTPIKRNIEYINEHICGAGDYEFVIDTKKEKGLFEPEVLAKVAALEDHIRTVPEFTHAISLVDLFKLEYQALHDGDPKFAVLPDSKQAIAELLLLLEMGKSDEHPLDQLVSFDRSKARISTRVRHLDTNNGLRVIEGVKAFAARELPELDVRVTGKNVMFTYVQEKISAAFIESIALAIALVLGALLVVFRSVKLAAIAILPSIAPIVVTMGFMGVSGIYLDFGTAMVASIALGIAVDDTIHIFSRFRLHGDRPSEIPTIMRRIGFAMCWSSLLIIAGFSVFIASDFRLNSNFGVLTAVVLVFGLLFDLFLTPALLKIVYAKNDGAA